MLMPCVALHVPVWLFIGRLQCFSFLRLVAGRQQPAILGGSARGGNMSPLHASPCVVLYGVVLLHTESQEQKKI